MPGDNIPPLQYYALTGKIGSEEKIQGKVIIFRRNIIFGHNICSCEGKSLRGLDGTITESYHLSRPGDSIHEMAR